MYTLSVHIRVFAVIMTVLLAGLAWAAEEEPFFDTEEAMFPGRFPTIVVATDGTVLAFGRDGKTVRRSEDGGETWGAEIETGVDRRANAIVDEDSGDVLLVSPTNGYQWRSRDHGETWEEEEMTVEPNLMGHGEPYGDIDVHDFAPPAESPVSAHYHESGITLQHGEHAGRLLMPVRVFTGSNDTEWRPYHYNTSMYSDDGGETWQVSAPFPVFGTGEGTLAELSDGRIYYNSREHMTEGNRYIAWSDDGGETAAILALGRQLLGLLEPGPGIVEQRDVVPSFGQKDGVAPLPAAQVEHRPAFRQIGAGLLGNEIVGRLAVGVARRLVTVVPELRIHGGERNLREGD